MLTDEPSSKHLVLVGGGHAHALLLRQWGLKPPKGIRCTLINPSSVAPYTGMLPGHIAGHYAREELDIDLVRLARFAGAQIVFASAVGLDRTAKRVHLDNDARIGYDLISLDVGATAELQGIDAFADHAYSVKPLGPFADAWQAFIARTRSDVQNSNCVVIGAGVAGVELALAMMHRMQQEGLSRAGITLIEAGSRILAGSSAGVRRYLLKACDHFGVERLTSVQVSRVSEDAVHLSNGQSLPANFVVSAAGARAYSWIAATGLALTNGFVNVGPDLRAINDPNLFAVGDCAHLTHAPRPKAGVYAVRQAPVLLHNIKAAFYGRPLKTFHPQSDYLKLISTGSRSAVGQKYWMAGSGPWLWLLKDHIDRKFMTGLISLPGID